MRSLEVWDHSGMHFVSLMIRESTSRDQLVSYFRFELDCILISSFTWGKSNLILYQSNKLFTTFRNLIHIVEMWSFLALYSLCYWIFISNYLKIIKLELLYLSDFALIISQFSSWWIFLTTSESSKPHKFPFYCTLVLVGNSPSGVSCVILIRSSQERIYTAINKSILKYSYKKNLRKSNIICNITD